MSSNSLMTLGTRAMFAAQAGMHVTAHNIANASVDGYSRQRVETTTAVGQFTSAGFFGKGADVDSVVRTYDEFLTRHAAHTSSQASFDKARYDKLVQLEEAFPTGEAGLGYAAAQMFNALSDVASRPGDIASRQVVLARAADLADRFNAFSRQVETLQSGVSLDIQSEIAGVNGLAESIAKVNDQIISLRGLGQPPNDLLDERDRLIHKLSSHLSVSAVAYDDGSYGIFVAGGQALVLGREANRLTTAPDPDDPRQTRLAVAESGSARIVSSDAVSSGSIGGLMRFQDDDIAGARALLDTLAGSIAARVNAQQAAGLDLDGKAGAPIFDTANAIRPAESIRAVMSDPRGIAAATPAADNGNAIALTALRDEAFVDGGFLRGLTFGEAWSSSMSDIGLRVQGARAAMNISGSVARQAVEQRDSNAGVNLDEEAARLIQYQQAYQAAAKVLQIAQKAMETLLATTTG